jgi:hypothetical protein
MSIEEKNEQERHIQKLRNAIDLMKILGISTVNEARNSYAYVSVLDLYDILMDDKKYKDLISKLKLKAFW